MGKRVLAVDDNPDILEILLILLKMEGFDALGINNGDHLSDEVRKFKPDLILLDVILGNLDGRDLCNTLKTQNSTAHIPIIMISASHKAQSMGSKYCSPNDFISKPFDIDDLIKRVKIQLPD